MTAIEHSTGHFAATEKLATRVIAVASNLFRAWMNRRAFYRLGEMSDAELADIGLTRADLSVAIDLPFGADPTARLNDITRSRAAV